MKRLLLTLGIILTLSSTAEALDHGRYRLDRLNRRGFNEYEAYSGTVQLRITTHFCTDISLSSTGILAWGGSYGSKLVIIDSFDTDKQTVCNVSEVWIKQQ